VSLRFEQSKESVALRRIWVFNRYSSQSENPRMKLMPEVL
jgi:hypothetical protein